MQAKWPAVSVGTHTRLASHRAWAILVLFATFLHILLSLGALNQGFYFLMHDFWSGVLQILAFTFLGTRGNKEIQCLWCYPVFIVPFNSKLSRHFLGAPYVPGSVLRAGNLGVNETQSLPLRQKTGPWKDYLNKICPWDRTRADANKKSRVQEGNINELGRQWGAMGMMVN